MRDFLHLLRSGQFLNLMLLRGTNGLAWDLRHQSEHGDRAPRSFDGPAQGLFDKKDLRRLAQILAGIIDGDVRLAGESQAANQKLRVVYSGTVELKLGPLGIDSAIQLGGVGAAIDVSRFGVPAPLIK